MLKSNRSQKHAKHILVHWKHTRCAATIARAIYNRGREREEERERKRESGREREREEENGRERQREEQRGTERKRAEERILIKLREVTQITVTHCSVDHALISTTLTDID